MRKKLGKKKAKERFNNNMLYLIAIISLVFVIFLFVSEKMTLGIWTVISVLLILGVCFVPYCIKSE